MNELERTAVAFDEAHEGQDGFVLWEGWVLFSDGARRSQASFGSLGCQMAEPHPNEVERRRWQKKFWEVRLEDLVTRFEQTKTAATNNVASDPARFKVRVAELKQLETAVRQARSKLAHLTTQERGFTQADVSRAWEVWEAFSQAAREESDAKQKYESHLLGRSSPGVLEKLKYKFDVAKKRSARAMERWNGFTPVEARGVVAEQLDANHQAERYAELQEIEI